MSGPVAAVAALAGYALLAHAGYFADDAPAPRAVHAPLTAATGAGIPLEPGALLVARNTAVAPVALDRRHLVWETWPRESEGATTRPRLVQQDLRTGRTATLAHNVDQFGGLASMSRWVVYASAADGRSAVAVAHDASRRVLLGQFLATPIASRSELVAWGEDDGKRQRIIVRSMATGVRWVAADMRRCNKGRCYRIDGVTLAAAGVVYARGAIGLGPSFVVRRRFSDGLREVVELRKDPQPDLAPSSTGALYYALGTGWFNWDFGMRSPHGVPISVPRNAQIIASEGATFFLHERHGCNSQLQMQHVAGKPRAVASPARLRSLTSIDGSCVLFTALVLNRPQPVTAWLVTPHEDANRGGEEDEEYASILLAGR